MAETKREEGMDELMAEATSTDVPSGVAPRSMHVEPQPQPEPRGTSLVLPQSAGASQYRALRTHIPAEDMTPEQKVDHYQAQLNLTVAACERLVWVSHDKKGTAHCGYDLQLKILEQQNMKRLVMEKQKEAMLELLRQKGTQMPVSDEDYLRILHEYQQEKKAAIEKKKQQSSVSKRPAPALINFRQQLRERALTKFHLDAYEAIKHQRAVACAATAQDTEKDQKALRCLEKIASEQQKPQSFLTWEEQARIHIGAAPGEKLSPDDQDKVYQMIKEKYDHVWGKSKHETAKAPVIKTHQEQMREHTEQVHEAQKAQLQERINASFPNDPTAARAAFDRMSQALAEAKQSIRASAQPSSHSLKDYQTQLLNLQQKRSSDQTLEEEHDTKRVMTTTSKSSEPTQLAVQQPPNGAGPNQVKAQAQGVQQNSQQQLLAQELRQKATKIYRERYAGFVAQHPNGIPQEAMRIFSTQCQIDAQQIITADRTAARKAAMFELCQCRRALKEYSHDCNAANMPLIVQLPTLQEFQRRSILIERRKELGIDTKRNIVQQLKLLSFWVDEEHRKASVKDAEELRKMQALADEEERMDQSPRSTREHPRTNGLTVELYKLKFVVTRWIQQAESAAAVEASSISASSQRLQTYQKQLNALEQQNKMQLTMPFRPKNAEAAAQSQAQSSNESNEKKVPPLVYDFMTASGCQRQLQSEEPQHGRVSVTWGKSDSKPKAANPGPSSNPGADPAMQQYQMNKMLMEHRNGQKMWKRSIDDDLALLAAPSNSDADSVSEDCETQLEQQSKQQIPVLPSPTHNTPSSAQESETSQKMLDYQMQLMLLEQQNKKRLMMARQEQDQKTSQTAAPNPPAANYALRDYEHQLKLLDQQNARRLTRLRQAQDSMNFYTVPASQPVPNAALADYNAQLQLLEQQNAQRLMMARHQRESTHPQAAAPIQHPALEAYNVQLQMLEQQNAQRVMMARRQREASMGYLYTAPAPAPAAQATANPAAQYVQMSTQQQQQARMQNAVLEQQKQAQRKQQAKPSLVGPGTSAQPQPLPQPQPIPQTNDAKEASTPPTAPIPARAGFDVEVEVQGGSPRLSATQARWLLLANANANKNENANANEKVKSKNENEIDSHDSDSEWSQIGTPPEMETETDEGFVVVREE